MKIRNIDIDWPQIDDLDNVYGLIKIGWIDERLGYGELEINIYDKDESVTLRSEYMGKEFVKQILNKIVDDAELVD